MLAGSGELGERILQITIEARQLVQERVVVIGEAVGDLVDDTQPGAPQEARLPQGQNRAAQPLVIRRQLFGRQVGAVALGQEVRYLHLAVDHALAPYLGRVGGQYRGDGGGLEERPELVAGNACFASVRQRLGHRAVARRRLGLGVGPGATDPVLVLGDVGEVRKIPEGADDLARLLARQPVHDLAELTPRGFVLVAAKADRGLADLFDDVEDALALLLAHRVAEDAAEQPCVLAQRPVLVGVARRCLPGMRHDLLRV